MDHGTAKAAMGAAQMRRVKRNERKDRVVWAGCMTASCYCGICQDDETVEGEMGGRVQDK